VPDDARKKACPDGRKFSFVDQLQVWIENFYDPTNLFRLNANIQPSV
jgi:hypothetical protein